MDEELLEATISIRGIVCRPDKTVLTIEQPGDDGWELPGGRIRRGECVLDCLHREIREETGLRVTVHGPVDANSWCNEAGQDRFAVYYHCSATGDEDVTLSHEHTAAAWVDEAMARERLNDPQAIAATRALGIGDAPLLELEDGRRD